jgi:hypothetical protein
MTGHSIKHESEQRNRRRREGRMGYIAAKLQEECTSPADTVGTVADYFDRPAPMTAHNAHTDRDAPSFPVVPAPHLIASHDSAHAPSPVHSPDLDAIISLIPNIADASMPSSPTCIHAVAVSLDLTATTELSASVAAAVTGTATGSLSLPESATEATSASHLGATQSAPSQAVHVALLPSPSPPPSQPWLDPHATRSSPVTTVCSSSTVITTAEPLFNGRAVRDERDD